MPGKNLLGVGGDAKTAAEVGDEGVGVGVAVVGEEELAAQGEALNGGVTGMCVAERLGGGFQVVREPALLSQQTHIFVVLLCASHERRHDLVAVAHGELFRDLPIGGGGVHVGTQGCCFFFIRKQPKFRRISGQFPYNR